MKSEAEKNLVQAFQKDGYVLIKGVFSPEEISDLRDKVLKLKNRDGDILSHDSLRHILLDDRVLAHVRNLLADRIVYCGDSSVNFVDGVGYRGFHQDSTDDFEDPITTECPIVRLGIYLQDHAHHSGGLKVRRGSHRHVYLGPVNLRRLLTGEPNGPLPQKAFRLGKGVNLDIEPGDLAIWNLRTWHTGNAVRLKWLPNLCLSPRVENYIPEWMLLPDIRPRAAFFATFGLPSARLETYIKERATHYSNEEHWKACRFDEPSIAAECAAKNIDLRFDGLTLSRSGYKYS